MSDQNNSINRDRSVYLDHIDEISDDELDAFFGLPKDEKKAVKVSGGGVFTPFSSSRTAEILFPTFINVTEEAEKRRRLRAIEKAIERQNNNEDDQ